MIRAAAVLLAGLSAIHAVSPGLPAQVGRVVDLNVGSPALANHLGDPLERRILVYLPPGYEGSAERRYPVVYLLHGFGAGPRTWLGGEGSYEGLDVASTLDRLIGVGALPPVLVVMPDAKTRLGGSWYAASEVVGNWEAFIADDLVDAVDARFPTVHDPRARGIAGQSMGGYGALRIAMLRPGIFGAVLAMSPVLVEDPNPLGVAGARIALAADPEKLAEAPLPARVLWSRAAAFTPDPQAPPAFARLPFRRDGGDIERVEHLWQRWEAATLSRIASGHVGALRGVAVRLEVGEDDALADEVRRLSEALSALGVDHELDRFPGGHVAGVRRRFENSVFQFFARAFEAR